MSHTTPRPGTKSPSARLADGAMVLMVLWGITAYFFYIGGGLQGRVSPIPIAVATALMSACWIGLLWLLFKERRVDRTFQSVRTLHPDALEGWVATRFRDRGYSVDVIDTTSSNGFDLIAKKGRAATAIQCRYFHRPSVGEPVLRELFVAMRDLGVDHAIVVTEGKLTPAAERWRKGKPISITGIEELATSQEK